MLHKKELIVYFRRHDYKALANLAQSAMENSSRKYIVHTPTGNQRDKDANHPNGRQRQKFRQDKTETRVQVAHRRYSGAGGPGFVK
jgi:hypothetical protein